MKEQPAASSSENVEPVVGPVEPAAEPAKPDEAATVAVVKPLPPQAGEDVDKLKEFWGKFKMPKQGSTEVRVAPQAGCQDSVLKHALVSSYRCFKKHL